jgi:hypothetical protein
MQDLFESYVSDLNKLRDAFHDELTATAKELTEALGKYASRSETALSCAAGVRAPSALRAPAPVAACATCQSVRPPSFRLSSHAGRRWRGSHAPRQRSGPTI